MTALTKRQALLERDLRLRCQVQGPAQYRATTAGAAGSQRVYTFEKGRFSSLKIMLAPG